MENQQSSLLGWLERRSRNILWLVTRLKRVIITIILRTFRFVTSLKGATIIIMVAAPFVILAFLDVPKESREIALLCSVCEALALIVGVGIAVFLGMAQIYSPYHTPRTLLTPQTLALLGVLLVGILLALAVLQGSHLTQLQAEPLVFGPFRVSWAHASLIWFAESLLVLPLYIRYAVGRLGASGLIDDSKNHLLREITASRPPIPSIVERHVKVLGDVALTALERKEYLTLELAFLTLGNLLWRADAAARSESQFKGRARVVFYGLSMQPAPPGQTDPWRVIYRELCCVHNAMLQSSELMIRECGYLRDIAIQAIEEEKASITVLVGVLFLKQVLDRAIDKNDAEVAKLAPTELKNVATAAVKTALTQMSRTKIHRQYLLTGANRAIKGIEDAFVVENEKRHLKESIPRTAVWDGEVLSLAASNIRAIAWTVGDVLISTPESECLSNEDGLEQHWCEGVVRRAIEVLSILRHAFMKSGRLNPAKEAIYYIASLGIMAARLGWSPITKVAIYPLRQHASQYLTHTGAEFKAAVASIESISTIGLTAALQANDGMTALQASLALTSIAQMAINTNRIDVALNIIGGKSMVVTILGTCRHKSVVLQDGADQEIMNLAVDLRGIATSPVVGSQLRDKASQALYELDQWSRQTVTSTDT